MEAHALIIHGCGGHARSVAANLLDLFENIIFADAAARPGEVILGCKVVKDFRQIENFQHCLHHVALGDLERKKELFMELSAMNLRLPALAVRSAEIHDSAELGDGTFVGVGAYVGPLTVIGKNSIINTHAVIEHDSRIGDHTHISVNSTVAGYCRIGSQVMLGAGATVIDKTSIGDNCIIGAGGVVCKDLSVAGTYVGVPVKLLKKQREQEL